MPYLTANDYIKKIQSQNLQQVISDDDDLRLFGELEALTEIKSYLAQKFDIADQFRDTLQFDYTTEFKAKQLVYLDADAFAATTVYITNDIVLQGGNVYYSTDGSVAHAFDADEWTLLGKQYKYFYVSLPHQEFDHEGAYVKDDFTFYKNKIYVCLRDTLPLSQSTKLQYGEYDQLPGINEFPDVEGQSQWALSEQEDYTVSQTWPTNTDSYTEGDNRNPLLVGMNVVMAIHKLSPRIATHVIPEVWVKNYDDAVKWLKSCAKGDVTLDMKLLQPTTGRNHGRIRYGSSIKNVNNY